ncbi:MAG: hypothetical protein WCG34_06070 [Leptolinea sp.]
MKIISNTKLIKRNKRIGQVLTFVAMAVLIGGLALSINGNPENITYSYLALILGFMASQFGIHFTNRFGRSPRPDEKLSAELKGLDDRYSLYHYATAVSHLIVGPSGVWVIMPFHQQGTITFEKGKYKQKGGSLYLKIFAQEGLGRPDKDTQYACDDMQKFLSKHMDADSIPTVNALTVFTNPKTEVKAPDAPYPTMAAEKMKDFLRKKAKDNAFPPESADKVNAALIPNQK